MTRPRILRILPPLLLAATVSVVQAQTAGSPSAPAPGAAASGGGASSTALPLAVFALAAFALILILAKVIDLRRKREDRAIELQTQISEVLLRELGAGIAVTPTVHLPGWGKSPATVELTGQVPNGQVRQAALRIAAQAASRIRPGVEIQDHMIEGAASRTA